MAMSFFAFRVPSSFLKLHSHIQALNKPYTPYTSRNKIKVRVTFFISFTRMFVYSFLLSSAHARGKLQTLSIKIITRHKVNISQHNLARQWRKFRRYLVGLYIGLCDQHQDQEVRAVSLYNSHTSYSEGFFFRRWQS